MSASEPTAPTHRQRMLARLLLGLTVGGTVVAVVLLAMDAVRTDTPILEAISSADIPFTLTFMVFPFVGYVIAKRQPQNSLGWLLLGIGGAMGIGAIVDAYAVYAVHGGFGGRDAGAVAAAINEAGWVPIVPPVATFLILLFPDGHLPSPRWRWFAWTIGIGLGLVWLMILILPGPMSESPFPNMQNPLGIEALRPLVEGALALLVVLPIGIIGSVTGLVLRYRRSTGVERLQLRWLVTAATVMGILFVSALVGSFQHTWGGAQEPVWVTVLQNLGIYSFALIPIAIGIAVLRHRLYDIDVVINRAVLFGALAVFITVVYGGVVVGVGALVGSRGDPVLSAVAAAIVALAFQPVRRRAQRLADRLVYGKRATPYEVLSAFSERVGSAYANDDLLPRMARALAEGTGAVRTDVLIRVGDQMRPAATWPEDAEPPAATPVDDEEATSSVSMRVPVRHQGEVLGALSIEKKAGDSITAVEEKLVRDLAAQAGLVLRNAALTEQLLDHIEQLRASRQRLVHAQDEERRKLERNLHDGAQQQLVALAVRMRLAEQLIDRDAAKAKETLAALQGETADAIETLRDLARGIYPPLLADQGLTAALQAQARKAAIPTEVAADGIARYPEDVEATIYFCALEALNNAAKYSGAKRAEVRLAQQDGYVAFEVSDDGMGFDAEATSYGTGLSGMADRIDAVGGMFEVRSSPGEGTTISGRVPVR